MVHSFKLLSFLVRTSLAIGLILCSHVAFAASLSSANSSISLTVTQPVAVSQSGTNNTNDVMIVTASLYGQGNHTFSAYVCGKLAESGGISNHSDYRSSTQPKLFVPPGCSYSFSYSMEKNNMTFFRAQYLKAQ